MREIVVLTIDSASRTIEKLTDGSLLRSVTRTIELLKKNPFYGDQIHKRIIPKQLIHLPNLWRAELSHYWRLLYYIASDEQHMYVIIFAICDHAQYDKIFGYRKK